MSHEITLVCENLSDISQLKGRFPENWISHVSSRLLGFHDGDIFSRSGSVHVGWDGPENLRESIDEMRSSLGFPAGENHFYIYYVNLTRDIPFLGLQKLIDHDGTWIDHAGVFTEGKQFWRRLMADPDWNWDAKARSQSW